MSLVDELGVDPSPALQSLHQQILRNDPALTPASPTIVFQPAADAAVPHQLPPPPRSFAGRTAELAQLDALLASEAEPTAVVISALSGTAGVGKTALALH